MGLGRDEASSDSARPPAREPVNPTARMPGSPTRPAPAARPSTSETTSALCPAAAAPRFSAEAHFTDVSGGASWPLMTTGQPAARAEAVSPPGTEKAKGKFDAPNTAGAPRGGGGRGGAGGGPT